MIFGAGGFVGVNLLHSFLLDRKDVYGVSRDPERNWRFLSAKTPKANLLKADVNSYQQLEKVIKKIKPQTIFNLSAYGAYSKQTDYQLIYQTNFNATIDILEIVKLLGFARYVHAGSSSEYGLNSTAPKEEDELIPNSHYAISKVAASYALKYYGKIERLPVINLRLYAVYGPWEEPDRLIPRIVGKALERTYPPLVQPEISRDFIYVSDVISAFVLAATKEDQEDDLFGESFNVGTGVKTKIKDLAYLVKDLFGIKESPEFGSMANRRWDLTEWFGNIQKIEKRFKWRPEVDLKQGLLKTSQWQREIGYAKCG